MRSASVRGKSFHVATQPKALVQQHQGRRRVGTRADPAVFEPHVTEIKKTLVGQWLHDLRGFRLMLAVQTTLHDLPQFLEALLDRRARGVEYRLGAGIIGAARIENGDQIRHRRAVVRHRTQVPLLHHPAHVLIGAGLHPDGVTAVQQQPVGFGVRDNPAGGGDDGGLMSVQNALEAGALIAPEGRKSCHLDQIGETGAIFELDDAIKLNEGAIERLRQSAAQRRFAGAAQADQRDPSRPIAGTTDAGVAFDEDPQPLAAPRPAGARAHQEF